jgi:hypothetical protein
MLIKSKNAAYAAFFVSGVLTTSNVMLYLYSMITVHGYTA